MGKLNILKSGYEGKVGEVYGVAKKGSYIAKAVPFSHAPHNNAQRTAKNEFTGLNRVASRIVKVFWKYLNLSDKKMYRNNALCQKWKGALKGGTFSINNLQEVISNSDALIITTIKYDPQTFQFVYSATEQNPTQKTKNQAVYLGVITNRQITKADIVGIGDEVVLNSIFDIIDFAYFQVWAFKAVTNGKKYNLEGLSISAPIYVIIVNGVFFVLRWRWVRDPYVINKVFYLPPEPTFIESGTLYLR